MNWKKKRKAALPKKSPQGPLAEATSEARRMGTSPEQRGRECRRQVLFPFLFSLLCQALGEQISYSIPEEMAKGSVVGHLARDLGLNIRDVSARKLRVSAEKQLFTVSADSGDLLVSDRIDREQICGNKPECAVELETVVETPLNVFHLRVTITDINDNAPRFKKQNIDLVINELALPGAKFGLEFAQDPDIGINTVQSYHISQNSHFSLVVKENPDGSKFPELLLEKPLDREQRSSHYLVLTAVDGGDPVRSGTAQIRINVTDANDNAPVFRQDVYKVGLRESLPPGSPVLLVEATDRDDGVNAQVTYSFKAIQDDARNVFNLDPFSGQIKANGILDFEETNTYTITVEAKDGGGLTAECKIIIEILDDNDNAPDVTFTSASSTVPEDCEPGTVIALIKIRDRDSGDNGAVTCRIEGEVPFKIISSSSNYYKLVTDSFLDREQTAEYNITVTATDRGKPPLTTSKTISLFIADVNDNPPVFPHATYEAYVPENNRPGASIYRVSASDRDLDDNARISYSLLDSSESELPLSSSVSINSHSGDIYAQRSFDYEQFRAFELLVQAQDSGSPPLRANVTVRVFIVDQNDNAPRILYPSLGPDGSALFDTVPRSAEPGYLVSKVVAVDADSGPNAWLAYHVLQASDPGLFSLGLRTGEIRTARALADGDPARHRLVVAVRDGGQPPLSSTVALHLVFADSLQEALPELNDRSSPTASQTDLQFYLVLALALISVLFLVTVILAIAMRCRHSSKPGVFGCLRPALYSQAAGPIFPPNYKEGTLPYSYQLCLSSDQGKGEFPFPILNGQRTLGGEVRSDYPSDLVPEESAKDLENILSDFANSAQRTFRSRTVCKQGMDQAR
ncbi:protocadherin gamma-B7-like [Tachyglossus aculeatus]|uniref:protocadherin gamma-B7-like n=1 Tax=Tachyglossus aculeatus TaxID=9261 RepID=UPI0018F5C2F2|nr:protocadherin gamma-B7-like [Tachyglossus aculeatus]